MNRPTDIELLESLVAQLHLVFLKDDGCSFLSGHGAADCQEWFRAALVGDHEAANDNWGNNHLLALAMKHIRDAYPEMFEEENN